ncbi:hypothetical protein A0257_07765 [Hymenobacter psoromatis]|nr:hypothetical protein A0257_07765 [Hymenobacter psoromatis]
MKKFTLSAATLRGWLLPALLLAGATTAAQAQNNIGIGTTTPNASAALDVSSTTQGLLTPRLTASQRGSIASPATGLLVYQTDGTAGFYFYNGTAWTALSGGSGGSGSQGPKGDTGAAGPKGDKGDTGAAGLAGLAGAKGDKGDTGAAGLAGAKGDKGDAGTAGTKGDKGDAGTAGPKGDKGDTGTAGTAGAKGDTGAAGGQGPKGDAGTAGAKGDTGAAGSNGQGVPTGGTAGQVLSKVDGTNYNTQWSTPTGSSGAYPSIELNTSVASSQAVTPLAGSNTYVPLVFSSSNGTGAALSGGNAWNGSVFTVGSAGAGTYQVTVQMMPITSTGTLTNVGVQYFLDKNNAIGNTTLGTYPYALSTYNLNPSGFNYRFNSTISTVIYLAAGDQITFRGESISTSATAYTSTDGSSNLQIVRLK